MALSERSRTPLTQLSKKIANAARSTTVSQAQAPGILESSVSFPLSTSMKNRHKVTRGLRLAGREFKLYHEALASLIQEPELEHLTDREIRDQLWILLSDFHLNAKTLSKSDARLARIRKFEDRVLKPHSDVMVMIPVLHLELHETEITVGDVRFIRLNTKTFEFSRGKKGSFQRTIFGPHISRTVALTTVSGFAPKKIADRARAKIAPTLDAMRVSYVQIPVIHDEQALIRLSGDYLFVAPGKAPSRFKPLTGGWKREYGALPLGIDQELANAASETLDDLARLFGASLPVEIRASLLRALSWISISLVRDNWDDQLLNLCTAMEIMLSRDSERQKSEPLSVRTLLLAAALDRNELVLYPVEFLWLYDKRSDLVHGGPRGEVQKKDVHRLRRLAVRTLMDMILLTEQNPCAIATDDVINLIETEEGFHKLDRHLAEWSGPGPKRLEHYLQKRGSPIQSRQSVKLHDETFQLLNAFAEQRGLDVSSAIDVLLAQFKAESDLVLSST